MLCDASVLVPLLVPEATSDTVSALVRHSGQALVSDFAFGEVCSAISIRLRRREITFVEAEETLVDLEGWVARGKRRIVTEPEDIALATRLVRQFDLALKMPDALHLALAIRLGKPIATQDRRQAMAARSLGLDVVMPIVEQKH